MEHEIEVMSSDGETKYIVVFSQTAKGLGIACTCPAGLFGKLCKHKLQLLTGNLSALPVSSSENIISEITEWIKQSDIGVLARNVASAEAELVRAKNAVGVAKKKLERTLYERSHNS